jgi:hypothetical protein
MCIFDSEGSNIYKGWAPNQDLKSKKIPGRPLPLDPAKPGFKRLLDFERSSHLHNETYNNNKGIITYNCTSIIVYLKLVIIVIISSYILCGSAIAS